MSGASFATMRCPRRTFCERLPDLVAAQARRTTRLQREQQRLAIDIGGEAGARLAFRQGMPVSPATLLRFVRRTPLPSSPTPRVLGVDDFSLHKGQVFGTILVDLERHQPIDLLPDRSSDTLAEWLTTHPGVEVISRDRSPEYADGATRGAPSAVQVADRFHLLQNLRDAVQRVLEQHLAVLTAAQTPPPVVTAIPPAEPPDQSATLANALISPPTAEQSPSVVRTRREQQHAERRARRHARYAQVRALHQDGQGIRAIAQQMGISRHTVRCFVRADQFPEQGQRRVQRRTLDPFLPYVRDQLAQGHDNGAAVWRMLRDQHGYTGARSSVTQWIADHRHLCPAPAAVMPSRRGRPPATHLTPAPVRRRSARQVAWLLIRRFDDLGPDDQHLVERLTQSCSAIQHAYTLSQAFLTMVKTRNHAAFEQWMADAHQSEVGEFQSFAAGLARDGAAVRAALRLPYSNGQVEGQVNRLKLIKRMAYGRSKFDLLRQRVLAA